MAEIQVSSWSDFLLAVQEEGADVILPQNALWDMNEIAPEGVSSLPTISCSRIYGNNTEIRNLNSSGAFSFVSRQLYDIDNLHIVNAVSEHEIFHAPAYGHVQFTGCKMSGLFGAQASGLIYTDNASNASALRCSFVCDSQRSGWFGTVNGSAIYCRMHIAVPNGLFDFPGTQKWSYFRVDQPTATHLRCYGAVACVYDGQMQSIETCSDVSDSFISVFNKTGMPNLPDADSLKGVTSQQLRDPAYLASIGFPIGYDPPEQ